MKKINSAASQKAPFNCELDDALHPEQAFEHPQHVVEAPDLTLNPRHPQFMGREGASQKRLVTALTDEALTGNRSVDTGAKVSPTCGIVPAGQGTPLNRVQLGTNPAAAQARQKAQHRSKRRSRPCKR